MATLRTVLVLLLALAVFSQATSAATFALTPALGTAPAASKSSGEHPCHRLVAPAQGAKEIPSCCDKTCSMVTCAAGHVAMLPSCFLMLDAAAPCAVATECERPRASTSRLTFRPPISLLG